MQREVERAGWREVPWGGGSVERAGRDRVERLVKTDDACRFPLARPESTAFRDRSTTRQDVEPGKILTFAA